MSKLRIELENNFKLRVLEEEFKTSSEMWKRIRNTTNCIIYLIGLNDFFKLCYNDDLKGIFLENLRNYKEFHQKSPFNEMKTILIFSKYDLFLKDFDKTLFNKLFPQFQGQNARECLDFVINYYRESIKDKELDVFVADLTNHECVNEIWEKIKLIILENKRFELFISKSIVH